MTQYKNNAQTLYSHILSDRSTSKSINTSLLLSIPKIRKFNAILDQAFYGDRPTHINVN